MTAKEAEKDPFADVDPSSIRLQWLGGFYPSGAMVALEIRVGRDRRMKKLFNPANPEDGDQLYRFSKSNQIVVEGLPDYALPLFHGSQARHELQIILDKAQAHIARCRRLDWQNTIQHFNDSAR